MPSRRSSAPISPGGVQASANARMRRFSPLLNWRRCATATTSGSGGALDEVLPVALRAPANTSSRATALSTTGSTSIGIFCLVVMMVVWLLLYFLKGRCLRGYWHGGPGQVRSVEVSYWMRAVLPGHSAWKHRKHWKQPDLSIG